MRSPPVDLLPFSSLTRCSRREVLRNNVTAENSRDDANDNKNQNLVEMLYTCNGLSYENIEQEGLQTIALDMFFSVYPRIIGMKYFPNITTLILNGQNTKKISDLGIINSQFSRILNVLLGIHLQFQFCQVLIPFESGVSSLRSGSILKDFQVKMKKAFNLVVQFLLMEWEPVGNIHFEDLSNNPWFTSCCDIIQSQFCTWDFRAYSITERKINHIFRVHNPILRLKFKKFQINLRQALDFTDREKKKQPTQPGHFDTSHNHVVSPEGIRGLSKLQFFNLSWNQLEKSREDINILHKHTFNLLSFDITHNPWHRSASLQLSVHGQLNALTKLQGVLISNEEAAKALQYSAGSKMTQVSLLEYSRTDEEKTAILSVFPSTKFLLQICRCIVEKLEHLRASLSNNNLTIEGMSCLNLKLTLDENCISTLDGRIKAEMISQGFLATQNGLLTLHLEQNQIQELNSLQTSVKLRKLFLDFYRRLYRVGNELASETDDEIAGEFQAN
ncbi:LOW QUALITY PROTEIN: leucine-rich repeat-containing protein 9 [Rhynochetos jubatus]